MPDTKPKSQGNPLKECDETLAVLDAWGDSYDRNGSGRGYGWWMVAGLVIAAGVLGVMAGLPGVVHWFTSI